MRHKLLLLIVLCWRIDMKKCPCCAQKKPINEFGIDNRQCDGVNSICLICRRVISKKSRDKDPERTKAVAKKFRDSQDKEKTKITRKESYSRRKGKILEYTKEYHKKNPAKRKAHKVVRDLIKSGGIINGCCEVCGENKNTQAHHDDYEKPEMFRWLCPSHHRIWHIENGAGANG